MIMRKVLPFVLPIFRTIIFIIGGLTFSFFSKKTLEESSKYWPLLCTGYNLITIMILILVCKIEKLKYKDILMFDYKKIIFSKRIKMILIMILIGILGMIGFSYLFYKGLPEFLIKPIVPALAFINLILLPATIVLAEMPLYFGYSLKRLIRNRLSKYFALGYTVFFYALQHSFIPLMIDINYMFYRFLSFLPLAFFIGFKFVRENDLTNSLIAHGVMDLSTSLQVVFVSVL